MVNIMLAAGTSVVEDIFSEIANIASQFVTFLASLFTSVAGLIWVSGTGLTTLGTLLLIALATGLVMWAFYFIRSLVRIRRG